MSEKLPAGLKIGKRCIHNATEHRVVEWKMVRHVVPRNVLLMAVCKDGRYAMVRKPYSMPYVADVRDLEPETPNRDAR